MSYDSLGKICVILGAGASADVHNGSAPVIQLGQFKPPLARDLFDIEEHPDYFELLQHYPGAMAIAGELSPKCRSKEFEFELALRQSAEHKDERVRQQFKHVPPYLRDLIWKASYGYTSIPGAYVQLVRALLSDEPHQALFLVLNYDTLLEQALTLYDPSMDFTSMASYIGGGRQAKVVKLHGSVNWLRLIGGKGDTWEEKVKTCDIFQRPPDTSIHITHQAGPLETIVINGSQAYPILTAPLAGKDLADMVCPETHTQAAKEFLKDCSKYLIIGTSGLDQDLLEFLDESISPAVQPIIHLVGRQNAEGALSRFKKAVRAFRQEPRPQGNAVAFSAGFRKYMDSGELLKFAATNPRHAR